MTCFEVAINEKLICTAGIKDNDVGVLIASLELSRRSPKTRGQRYRDYFKLRVSGSETNNGRLERVDWLNRSVRVGDIITIRIVEASRFDEPKNRESME